MRRNLLKMISYYKPYIGTFMLDMFFAFLASAISLIIPLAVRYITVNVHTMDSETALKQVITIGIILIVLVAVYLIVPFFPVLI